ncbi:MAG TPA: SoxR reducing system RseC family protein, partial [Rhodocyclaceae bacterium]|nr:SoxR reducing system RseC family protein [Rhodocyclaceae bacterium]
MTNANGRHTVEGIARVVRVDGGMAWLEPEQTTSCGHCASSSSCGAKGIGTVGARLEARRFPLDNDDALRVGERIVVGVDDRSLLKAAALAYGLPLAAALLAGGIADGVWADDPVSMAAAAGG